MTVLYKSWDSEDQFMTGWCYLEVLDSQKHYTKVRQWGVEDGAAYLNDCMLTNEFPYGKPTVLTQQEWTEVEEPKESDVVQWHKLAQEMIPTPKSKRNKSYSFNVHVGEWHNTFFCKCGRNLTIYGSEDAQQSELNDKWFEEHEPHNEGRKGGQCY